MINMGSWMLSTTQQILTKDFTLKENMYHSLSTEEYKPYCVVSCRELKPMCNTNSSSTLVRCDDHLLYWASLHEPGAILLRYCWCRVQINNCFTIMLRFVKLIFYYDKSEIILIDPGGTLVLWKWCQIFLATQQCRCNDQSNHQNNHQFLTTLYKLRT